MIVIPDYRGFRIEVDAVAVDGRWNAEVRLPRIPSSDKPRVEQVICYKLSAEHAERAGEIWSEAVGRSEELPGGDGGRRVRDWDATVSVAVRGLDATHPQTAWPPRRAVIRPKGGLEKIGMSRVHAAACPDDLEAVIEAKERL